MGYHSGRHQRDHQVGVGWGRVVEGSPSRDRRWRGRDKSWMDRDRRLTGGIQGMIGSWGIVRRRRFQGLAVLRIGFRVDSASSVAAAAGICWEEPRVN